MDIVTSGTVGHDSFLNLNNNAAVQLRTLNTHPVPGSAAQRRGSPVRLIAPAVAPW